MKTYPTITRRGIVEMTAEQQESLRRQSLSETERLREDVAALTARVEKLERAAMSAASTEV